MRIDCVSSRNDSASVLIPFVLSTACILSSSALLYFFLVPIVLREFVLIVVDSPENFEVFASFITVERPTGLTVGFEFWSLIESSTDSSNSELFISLLQDWLGEDVELCYSIPILSGKNNVRVSARRSLQYSVSHCVSWKSMLRIWS